MKKNKMKLDKKQFPEQVVETQVEQVELTEEEHQKKGVIGWILKHKKGISITGIGIALALYFTAATVDNMGEMQKNKEELPENPGYEDVQEENQDIVTVTPKTDSVCVVEKKLCECTDGECLCDDDELGCTCTKLEHEESCIANVIAAEEENIATDASVKDEKETGKQETKKEETEHIHVFGKWESINDYYEQRICECGEKEIKAHVYVDEKTKYIYEENGKHNEVTLSKCSNCGHTKTKTVLDNCKNVILSFDAEYEYLKCDECGKKIKIKHVLDEGKTKEDGSTEYKCIHKDCKYKKTVEASKNNESKGEEDEKPVGPNDSQGENPTGPSGDKPTGPTVDPTGPTVDPTGPTVDPTGPSVDPTGPSVDPTGPTGEDGDRDFSDQDGNGNQNNEDAGNTGKEDGFEPDEDDNEDDLNVVAPDQSSPTGDDETTKADETTKVDETIKVDETTKADETTKETTSNQEVNLTPTLQAPKTSEDADADRGFDVGATGKEEGFELEDVSTVDSELQTLYAMREIVINGITLEYSVKTESSTENQQYTMKK